MFFRLAAAVVSFIMFPGIAPAATAALRPPTASALILVQAKPDPLGAHAAIEWARERLLEIDATLATLEEDAGRLRDDASKRADDAIAKLRATRDAYGAKFDAVGEDGVELRTIGVACGPQLRDGVVRALAGVVTKPARVLLERR